jgi:hypothetical protein
MRQGTVSYEDRVRERAECPECAARPGASCIGLRGQPVKYTHYMRRQAYRLVRECAGGPPRKGRP